MRRSRAVLVRHVKQIKALQETVVSLTVRFEEYPRVPRSRRAEVEQMADGFWHVTLHFGFTEMPNVVAALACAKDQGCPLNLDDAVYFAAHDDVVRRAEPPGWPPGGGMLFAVDVPQCGAHAGPLRPAGGAVSRGRAADRPVGVALEAW